MWHSLHLYPRPSPHCSSRYWMPCPQRPPSVSCVYRSGEVGRKKKSAVHEEGVDTLHKKLRTQHVHKTVNTYLLLPFRLPSLFLLLRFTLMVERQRQHEYCQRRGARKPTSSFSFLSFSLISRSVFIHSWTSSTHSRGRVWNRTVQPRTARER